MRPHRGLLTVAALLVLLFVAEALAVRHGLTRGLDRAFLGVLRQADTRALLGPAWSLKLVVGLTTLGAGATRAPVTIAAALVLALRHRGREAAMLAAAVAGGAIALPILKALFDRARPDLVWHLVGETTWSFPSGHAMGAMILYPLLGYIAGTTRGADRARMLAMAGVAVALLVGATRVILGVHWASDVIGGWLIGGSAALAAAGAFQRPSRDVSPPRT